MLRQDAENESSQKNSSGQESPLEPIAQSQNTKPKKQQNTRKTTIVILLLVAMIGCCFVALLLFFLNNAGLLGDTGILATATQTYTTTTTYTPTAKHTMTPKPTKTPTLTATPKLIPGIDQPITVSGVKVQVTGARFQEEYVIANKTWKASEPGEILLVVEGFILTTDMDKTNTWSVKTSDENDNLKKCSITITHTKDDRLEKEWLCAVDKTSTKFIIIFPDNQKIDLSSFFN